MADASILTNMAPLNLWVHGAVIGVGMLVAIVSFAFLIPLDSVPAVTGVSIIMAVMNRPGKMPAIKSAPIDTLAIMP